jgi:hypothetical protein
LTVTPETRHWRLPSFHPEERPEAHPPPPFIKKRKWRHLSSVEKETEDSIPSIKKRDWKPSFPSLRSETEDLPPSYIDKMDWKPPFLHREEGLEAPCPLCTYIIKETEQLLPSKETIDWSPPLPPFMK